MITILTQNVQSIVQKLETSNLLICLTASFHKGWFALYQICTSIDDMRHKIFPRDLCSSIHFKGNQG